MGTPIGQVTSALATLRAAPEFGRARLEGRGAAVDPSVQQPAGQSAQPNSGAAQPSQTGVGFGDGTLSTPALALRTLGRTVQEARETLPSLDELRVRFQLAAAERRAEIAEDLRAFQNRDVEQPIELRPVERGVPEAAPQVARFTEAAASFEGEPTVPPPETEAVARFDAPEAPTPGAPDAASDSPQPVALNEPAENEVENRDESSGRETTPEPPPRTPEEFAQQIRLDVRA